MDVVKSMAPGGPPRRARPRHGGPGECQGGEGVPGTYVDNTQPYIIICVYT